MGKKRAAAAEAPQEQQPQQTTGQGGGTARTPPAHTIQCGRLRGVAWANRDKEGNTWYSVNVTRSYKDGDGNWKTASSLGRDDLLPAAEILRSLWVWVSQQSAAPKPEATTNGNGQVASTTSEEPIPF